MRTDAADRANSANPPNPTNQADVLTNIPLKPDPLPCRLLASVVRNCCRFDVALDVLVAPKAVSRFSNALESVFADDDVLDESVEADVSVEVDVSAEAEVEVEADVAVELDASPELSDCARLSSAEARPPP